MHGKKRRSLFRFELPSGKKEVKINIPSLTKEFKPSLQTTSNIRIIPSRTLTSADIKEVLPVGLSGSLSATYKPTETLNISGGVHGSVIKPSGEKTISNIGGGINLTKKFKKFSLFGGVSGSKGGNPYYQGGISLNI